MALVTFPLSLFQDADGNPIGFGHILVRLSEDVKTPTSTQIGSSVIARINLDVNGSVIGSPLVWPNAELIPSDAVYIYSVYSQQGQVIVREASLTV